MTELLTFGETALRLSPPSTSRLETADRLDVWADGAASNVAIAASRLGTDSMWMSKLADTPMGRRAISELRGHGIETAVEWVEDDDARQALTFFESGNEPRAEYVFDDRVNTPIESVEPGELPMDTIQSADAVFVSGETLAFSRTIIETAQAVLRAAGGKAVFGLDYHPDLWSTDEAREAVTELFPAVDVFVTNEQEAKDVFKKKGEPSELAHQVANEWDFETVIVTRSEHGALVWHDATIHESDAFETEAVEAKGQHDAFTGAFLSRRLAGDDVGDALAYGIAAAGLARTIPGPVPVVNPVEVERIVAELDEGSPGSASGALR
jgi:2-dehydro-3-deoxygluconokinase